MNNFFKSVWRQKAFLAFAAVALVLWYINRLDESFTADISIPVRIVSDLDDGRWTGNPAMSVSANCTATGWTVLAYEWGTVSEIGIKEEKLVLTKTGINTYIIDNKSLLNAIRSQAQDMTVNYIDDTERLLHTAAVETRTVPVVADISATYAVQYMNAKGRIELGFDSVKIKAPIVVLDTVEFIRTERKRHEQISSTVKSSARLIIPDNVHCTETKVHYTIDATRCTQFKFKTKIKTYAPTIMGRNFGGNGLHWKRYRGKVTVIPQEVTVFVNIPMALEPDVKEVFAYVDFDDDNPSSEYEVQLGGLPSGSEIIAVEPRTINAFKEL